MGADALISECIAKDVLMDGVEAAGGNEHKKQENVVQSEAGSLLA